MLNTAFLTACKNYAEENGFSINISNAVLFFFFFLFGKYSDGIIREREREVSPLDINIWLGFIDFTGYSICA